MIGQRKTSRTMLVALTAVGTLALAAESPAAALLLDFGPTAIQSPYFTASPGYAAGDVALATPKWNTIGAADVASGALLWSDNTPATGIALDLTAGTGTTSAGPATLAFGGATQPGSSSGLGGGTGINVAGSVYYATSPGKDAIFSGSATTTYTAIGARLSGLADGEYRVYVTSRNTNLSSAAATAVSIAATSGAATYTIPALASESNVATTSWIAGNNYLLGTVTISADNPYLTVVTEGASSASDKRGFLNTLEIVSVPEPTMAALALLVGGFAAARRRRSF